MNRWGEKRYHSMDYDLKQLYGEKVYKITLNGGMTCPNRDGKIGHGGCIFCSTAGSGDFAGPATCSITKQLAMGKENLTKKRPVHSYIAYFQAFTNTYAPVEYLRQIYMEAIQDPDVQILSIATRPDCLPEDVLQLLEEINQTGIGPGGLGGRTTALAINIETYPTHIAGMPLAVNICCHVNRHAKRIL